MFKFIKNLLYYHGIDNSFDRNKRLHNIRMRSYREIFDRFLIIFIAILFWIIFF